MSVTNNTDPVTTAANLPAPVEERILFPTISTQQTTTTPSPASFSYPTGQTYLAQSSPRPGGGSDPFSDYAWQAALGMAANGPFIPVPHYQPPAFSPPIPTEVTTASPLMTYGPQLLPITTATPASTPQISPAQPVYTTVPELESAQLPLYANYKRLTPEQIRVLLSLKEAKTPVRFNQVHNPYRSPSTLPHALDSFYRIGLVDRLFDPGGRFSFSYSLAKFTPDQRAALLFHGYQSPRLTPLILELLK